MIQQWLRRLVHTRESGDDVDHTVDKFRRMADDILAARTSVLSASARQRITVAIVSLDREPPAADNANGFCIQSLRIVTTELLRGLDTTAENASDELVIASCMFIVAASQVLARDTGADFEQLSAYTPLNVFHRRGDGEKLADCVEQAQVFLATHHSEGGKALVALVANFASWLEDPCEERMSKLASLVGVIAEHIK